MQLAKKEDKVQRNEKKKKKLEKEIETITRASSITDAINFALSIFTLTTHILHKLQLEEEEEQQQQQQPSSF